MQYVTEHELDGKAQGVSFEDLCWLMRERKRRAAEIEEQAEREGLSIKNNEGKRSALRFSKRPKKRNGNKKPSRKGLVRVTFD